MTSSTSAARLVEGAEDGDLVGLGQLAEHVGQPLVVEGLGDLVPPLDRQVLQRVGDVGGVELAVGGDQRLGALPGLRQGQPGDLVPGQLVQLPAPAEPPGSWTASRESTQSPVRVCSMPASTTCAGGPLGMRTGGRAARRDEGLRRRAARSA
jgi:hypothetical protein